LSATEVLKRAKFDGQLLDKPIQFPSDVAQMRGWLRGRGLSVGDKDCQALWHRLSEEFYPFSSRRAEGAWLNIGYMQGIADEHAMEYLLVND
jgi:hypothetical protein